MRRKLTLFLETRFAAALAVIALATQPPLPDVAHGTENGTDRVGVDNRRLGTVSFQNSCRPRVQARFNRAVALLHSFWLDEAERTFGAVATDDPACAMAYWGIAMAEFNQVNGGPSPAGLIRAKQALTEADDAPEKDSREAAYLDALHVFYDGYTPQSAAAHAAKYTAQMQELADRHAGDLEAQAFYALALINSDPPDDVALINPKKAVAILEPLFMAHPDHPGLAHYIIHASDNPEMAAGALEAARRYAAIAPAVPHALHMPSHIFARLGLWQDDIDSNLASAAAASSPASQGGAENRLHAMEFLEYAYLQIGHDQSARAIVARASKVRATDVDTHYPTYYADVEARFPLLFTVETGDWAAAARLRPIEGGDWHSQAQTLLAHAIAAGHLRDARAGRAAEERIDELTASMPDLRTGSAIATLPDEIHAWSRFSSGDARGAISLLRPVADRQAKAGKGEVELPAREMIADMLSLTGDFQQALSEYEASLRSDPNRFNGLRGAARAAERTGDRELALRYYRSLVDDCSGADGEAESRLRQARAYLQSVGR